MDGSVEYTKYLYRFLSLLALAFDALRAYEFSALCRKGSFVCGNFESRGKENECVGYGVLRVVGDQCVIVKGKEMRVDDHGW